MSIGSDRNRFLLFCAILATFVASPLSAQNLTEEDEHFIIFNETIQVTGEGHARDVCFEKTGFNLTSTNQMIWVADPLKAGVQAIASRPIRDVAKAGETMGSRASSMTGEVVALDITESDTYLIDARGVLFVIHKGWVDSLRLAESLPAHVDLAGSISQLSYVLWGDEVRIYSNPPQPQPMWSFSVAEDLRPAIALAVGERGEVVIAGQGRTALAVYDLDEDGQWTRVRSALASDLGVTAVQGLCLSQAMLLPEPGREGWVDNNRFTLLSDSGSNEVLALESATFAVVGRLTVRDHVPLASPGHLSVSNRGQIAFVDRRNGAAHVLPTSFTLRMVRKADFRWRMLDRPGEHRVLRPTDDPTGQDAPKSAAPKGEGG